MSFISQNIKYLRSKEKISQTEFAAILHKGTSVISSYEVGSTQPPLDVVISICAYFNVNIDTIINTKLEDEISSKNNLAKKNNDNSIMNNDSRFFDLVIFQNYEELEMLKTQILIVCQILKEQYNYSFNKKEFKEFKVIEKMLNWDKMSKKESTPIYSSLLKKSIIISSKLLKTYIHKLGALSKVNNNSFDKL